VCVCKLQSENVYLLRNLLMKWKKCTSILIIKITIIKIILNYISRWASPFSLKENDEVYSKKKIEKEGKGIHDAE